MLNTYKNCLVMIMFVLLSLGITNGLAYGATFTLDGREDAGLYPGQGAFLEFFGVDNACNHTGTMYSGPLLDPGWTHYISSSPSDTLSVNNYAYYAAGIRESWRLESAGNIWSSDKIVGESMTGLHAGTYRVSPIGSAFEYAFSDDPPWNKFWWQLSVLGHDVYVNGQLESDYSAIVGSTNPYDTAAEALQDNLGKYTDITVAEGGSLAFWIYDWNSIDNSGSLTFSVNQVPEPSTFLLLTVGLAFLIRKIRT